MTHPYTITRREIDGLSFAIDWIDRSRQRAHADDCRSREPSAQCSCGLHRVLSTLRQTRNDMEAAMLAASDKPAQVLTETEGMRIVVAAGLKGGHVITTNAAAHIARAVEAAILAKLA